MTISPICYSRGNQKVKYSILGPWCRRVQQLVPLLIVLKFNRIKLSYLKLHKTPICLVLLLGRNDDF